MNKRLALYKRILESSSLETGGCKSIAYENYENICSFCGLNEWCEKEARENKDSDEYQNYQKVKKQKIKQLLFMEMIKGLKTE